MFDYLREVRKHNKTVRKKKVAGNHHEFISASSKVDGKIFKRNFPSFSKTFEGAKKFA